MSIAYAPMNVVLQTGNAQNLITWNPVVGATSYSVQRSVDGIIFTTLPTAPTTNLYLDSSVSVGVPYYYQVASVNTSGVSGYSVSYPTSIVPCLPGQMSLGYIRYLAQLRADKLNSNYLTTDEWNSNINQSTYDLYDLLVSKWGDDYFLAAPLLINLTGVNTYALPDGSASFVNSLGQTAPAIYKLNGVDANVGGTTSGANAGWIPLARANWSDRDRYTTFPGQAGALNNIYQMSYRMMGGKIHFFPANSNMVVRLYYVPVMTMMLQDADMLSFSLSGFVEYVINDAAMKAMVKEESFDKWNALNTAKGFQLERIETMAPNRDVGQPNAVSNVRATMGDPGFSNFGSGYGGFGSSGGGY